MNNIHADKVTACTNVQGEQLLCCLHLYFKTDCISIYFIVVERLMSKVPIKMMATELDIRPFTPLLQGGGSIENLEIHNLPKELTDDLLAMHIEGTIETTEISSAEYMCKLLIYINVTTATTTTVYNMFIILTLYFIR